MNFDLDPAARQSALTHMHSARSALLTLVSLYVYPAPMPVPTGALIKGLDLLGFHENAARQALNRAKVSGWVEARRVGRRSMWELSPAGHLLMDEGAERVRSLGERRTDWDGRFIMIYLTVPERDRQLQHIVRTRLSWIGFGSITPGTWISTNLASERSASQLLDGLGVDAFSFIAQRGAIGNLRDVVARAWDLSAVEQAYRDFISEFTSLQPVSGDAYFIGLTQLVHQYRRFPFIDPRLPQELLPASWEGDHASRLYRSLHALWFATASLRWKEIIAEFC